MMTPTERIIATVFGLAFVSALLSTPFLGIAPMLGVCSGLAMLAAVAHAHGRLSVRRGPGKNRRR